MIFISAPHNLVRFPIVKMVVFCKKCKKRFSSGKGHQQHLNSKPDCMHFHKQTLGFGTEKPRFPDFPFEKHLNDPERPEKRKESPTKKAGSPTKKAASPTKKVRSPMKNTPSPTKKPASPAKERALPTQLTPEPTPEEEADLEDEVPVYIANDDNDDANPLSHDDNEEDQVVDPEPAGPDYNHDHVIIKAVNTAMHDKFRAYCEKAPTHLLPFLTKQQQEGLRLMSVLHKTSMETYDQVLLWYLRTSGKIQPNEQLKDNNEHVSRSVLLDQLSARYNMEDKFPTQKAVILPFTGTKVDLVTYDAAACIESLLSDPRLKDSDFLFYDNDPYAEVPVHKPMYGDVNTGMAHIEAIRKYKKAPNQVVLPIIMYIDGATTGQMKDMPITALKMTLGIFNRKYRDQPQAWRVLGHVQAVTKNISKARKRIRESLHVAGSLSQLRPGEGRGIGTKEKNKSGPSRDLHAMLDKILESYRKLQDNGIKWDLNYKGKLWDVLFIPYLLFIKCDTKEGDLLCGSYTSYTQHVKNLCRYCCCPNEDTDNPQAYYEFKTVPMVKKLVDAQNLPALKQISQQCSPNAFWRIRFSPFNDRGVHGACASEMLHAVELGNYMYLRDTFYEQVGPDSMAAQSIDEQSQLFGMQFGRQSERNMPNCQFRNGIREGKLNAKEYHGVLLVMASILHSTDGKETLMDAKWDEQKIHDWAYLVEIMLVWGAFLGQDEIPKTLMGKLGIRNRLVMWLIKKTANRKEGMGLRVMKYHAITHLTSDIHNFGVPKNVYTGSDESGHKLTKNHAKKTQKNMATFDMQTARREAEHRVMDLGLAELDGQKLWEYYDPRETESDSDSDGVDGKEPFTGETLINLLLDEHGRRAYSIGKGKPSRTPVKKKWDADVLDFLFVLQEKVGRWMNEKLEIRSDHRRDGKIYRGHPNYRSSGEPWKDWVVVDWGNNGGHVSAQIWCFVILRKLPTSNKKKQKWQDRLNHGGISPLLDGVYAVVEKTAPIPKQVEWNQHPELLFSKLRLEMEGQNKRKLFLVPVEKLVEPCFVVPDFGCQDRKTYFKIANRDTWPSIFQEWMDHPVPAAYANDKEGRRFET